MRWILLVLLLVGCSAESQVVKEPEVVEQETVVNDKAATCPSGVTDDPFPGRCRLYEDSDQDHECDLSY